MTHKPNVHANRAFQVLCTHVFKNHIAYIHTETCNNFIITIMIET